MKRLTTIAETDVLVGCAKCTSPLAVMYTAEIWIWFHLVYCCYCSASIFPETILFDPAYTIYFICSTRISLFVGMVVNQKLGILMMRWYRVLFCELNHVSSQLILFSERTSFLVNESSTNHFLDFWIQNQSYCKFSKEHNILPDVEMSIIVSFILVCSNEKLLFEITSFVYRLKRFNKTLDRMVLS